MDLNGVIQHTGRPSPYMVAVVCLTCLLNLTVNIENAAVNFLSPAVDHWCQVPELNNLSAQEQKNRSIPCKDADCEEYEGCKVFDLPWDEFSEAEITNWNPSYTENANISDTCQRWNYDVPTKLTTTSQFDLVCKRGWISDCLSPIYLAGLFVGSMISGPIADTYGRMPAFMVSVFLLAIGGLGSAFSVNVIMFAAFRFILGVSGRLGGITNVIIATELVAQEYRSASVGLSRLFYVTGPLILAGTAYITDSWRVLQLVLTLPFVFLILCYWYIPESPRWLIGNGSNNEAMKSIEILAKRSKTNMPKDILLEASLKKSSVSEEEPAPISVQEVFRHPLLRKWTIALGFAHLASMMVYMAVSMNLDRLFGNVYMNTILASVLEYPAVLLCLYSMAKLGRQRTMQLGLAIAAIGGVLSVVFILTSVPPMAVTVMLIIVRGAASVGVCSFTTLTTELFPSNIRQTALGITSAFSSFFTIFSPLIGGPLEQVWEPLPSLIFAILCSGSFCLNFVIPETLGKPMPETLEDLEHLNSESKLSFKIDANHNLTKQDKVDINLIGSNLHIENSAKVNLGFDSESIQTYL